MSNSVLDTPRLTCTATDQDGLMEQGIEKLDESVQVDEELIRQVVDDSVRSFEEIVERPNANKQTARWIDSREVFNPFEHVDKFATTVCHLSLNLVQLGGLKIVRDLRRPGILLDSLRLVKLCRKSGICPDYIVDVLDRYRYGGCLRRCSRHTYHEGRLATQADS